MSEEVKAANETAEVKDLVLVKPVIHGKGGQLFFNPEFVEATVKAIIDLKSKKVFEDYFEYIKQVCEQADEVFKPEEKDATYPEATVEGVTVDGDGITCIASLFLSRLFNECGVALLQKGLFEAADECFKKSYIYDDTNITTLYNLADVSFCLHEYELAIEYCDEVLKREEDHIGAIYLKGLAYSSDSKPEEAVTWFKKTVELDPNSMGGNYWAGECSLFTQDYEGAFPYFKRAYEISEGKHSDSARGYAICAMMVGQAEITVDICDALIKTDPSNQMMAMQIKGDAHIKLDQPVEAGVCHAQLVEVELDARDLVINRVGIIEKELSRDAALAYVHTILDIVPDMIDAFINYIENGEMTKKSDCSSCATSSTCTDEVKATCDGSKAE